MEDDRERFRIVRGDTELHIGGLAQTQLDSTSVEDEERVEAVLRRVRISLRARLGEWIRGHIEPDFVEDRVFLNSAYLLLNLHEGLRIRFGRSSRPFSALDDVSAEDLVPIERGARLRGVTAFDHYRLLEESAHAGRADGVQVSGSFPDLPLEPRYALGYFLGGVDEDGEDLDIDQLAAQLSVRPIAKLTVTAAWTNIRHRRDDSNESRRGDAFELSASWGEPDEEGLYLLVTGTGGVLSRFPDEHFFGGQIWAAYRSPELSSLITGVQPILRVSHGRPIGIQRELGGTLITPGVNVYLGGKNRIMLNVDLWRGRSERAESVKAQFQLAF